MASLSGHGDTPSHLEDDGSRPEKGGQRTDIPQKTVQFQQNDGKQTPDGATPISNQTWQADLQSSQSSTQQLIHNIVQREYPHHKVTPRKELSEVTNPPPSQCSTRQQPTCGEITGTAQQIRISSGEICANEDLGSQWKQTLQFDGSTICSAAVALHGMQCLGDLGMAVSCSEPVDFLHDAGENEDRFLYKKNTDGSVSLDHNRSLDQDLRGVFM